MEDCSMPVKCCKLIFAQYSSYPCTAKAKVTRNGKPYCLRHDPVAQKEKQISRNKAFDEALAKRTQEQRPRHFANKMLSILRDVLQADVDLPADLASRISLVIKQIDGTDSTSGG